MKQSITRKALAVVMSCLMAGSVLAVSVPAASAAETKSSTSTVTTTEWSNPKYPVKKDASGEYRAYSSEGKPVKFNGLQCEIITTKKPDGTEEVNTVRYTFEDGKCTDVKTVKGRPNLYPLDGTETKKAAEPKKKASKNKKETSADKKVASVKYTYSNDSYRVAKDADGKYIIVAKDSKSKKPVKFNGLMIVTETTTYSDGSKQVKTTRYTFKDGVNTSVKTETK